MSQDVLSIKPIAPEPTELPKLPPISASEQMVLEQKQESGANWFLWIAALSLINSLLILSNSSISFPVGLGITQIVDGIALLVIQEYQSNSPFIIQILAFVVDMAIVGFFTIFGLLAKKRHLWAFIVGMVLYVLDSLIAFFFQVWIGVAFHAWVLFGLWNGLQATRTYNHHKKEGRINVPSEGHIQVAPTAPVERPKNYTPSEYVPPLTVNPLGGLKNFGIAILALFFLGGMFVVIMNVLGSLVDFAF